MDDHYMTPPAACEDAGRLFSFVRADVISLIAALSQRPGQAHDIVGGRRDLFDDLFQIAVALERFNSAGFFHDQALKEALAHAVSGAGEYPLTEDGVLLIADEIAAAPAAWASADAPIEAVKAGVTGAIGRLTKALLPPKNEDDPFAPMDFLAAMRDPPGPIDFVLPGLKAGTVGLIGGAGGVSKSYFALQTAMSIALGHDRFHLWDGAPLTQGKVVFVSLEDAADVIQTRAHAISKHLRPEEEEALAPNMKVLPLYGKGFVVARREPTGRIIASPEMDRLKRVADGARLIVVDTLNRAASTSGLDENDACDMGAFMGVVENLCATTGAAMVMLHHLNKGGVFQGEAESLDQSALRGSSVLVDNARWLLMMATLNEIQAKKRYNDKWEEHHRRWVKRMVVKQNYGALIPDQWALRGDGGVLDGHEQPVELGSCSRPIVKNAPKPPKTTEGRHAYSEF